MKLLAIGLLAVALTSVGPLAAEDTRTSVKLPPDVRAAFLDEMRHHMDSLDNVIAAVAAPDFPRAAEVARTELGMGSGKGFGRFMPIEFREMGLAMHRSALEFADVAAAASAPPSAEDWSKVVGALSSVSSNCRACHSVFRVE